MHVFADFVFGTLSKPITAKASGATDTMFYDGASLHPDHTIPFIQTGEIFYMMIEERSPPPNTPPIRELVKVTAGDRDNNSLSVIRGVDGATGVDIPSNRLEDFDIYMIVVAQDLDNFIQKDDLSPLHKLSTKGFRLGTSKTYTIDGVTYVRVKLNFSGGLESMLYLPTGTADDLMPMYEASDGTRTYFLTHHPYHDGVLVGSMFLFNVLGDYSHSEYSVGYASLIERGYYLCDGRTRFNSLTSRTTRTPDLLGTFVAGADNTRNKVGDVAVTDTPTEINQDYVGNAFRPRPGSPWRLGGNKKHSESHATKVVNNGLLDNFKWSSTDSYSIDLVQHDHNGAVKMDAILGYEWKDVALVAAAGVPRSYKSYTTSPKESVDGYVIDDGKLCLMEPNLPEGNFDNRYRQSVYWKGEAKTRARLYSLTNTGMIAEFSNFSTVNPTDSHYYSYADVEVRKAPQLTFTSGSLNDINNNAAPANSTLEYTQSNGFRLPFGTAQKEFGDYGIFWAYVRSWPGPSHNYGGERIGSYVTHWNNTVTLRWGDRSIEKRSLRKNPEARYSGDHGTAGWTWLGWRYDYLKYRHWGMGHLNETQFILLPNSKADHNHTGNSAGTRAWSKNTVQLKSKPAGKDQDDYEHTHTSKQAVYYKSLCWFMKV